MSDRSRQLGLKKKVEETFDGFEYDNDPYEKPYTRSQTRLPHGSYVQSCSSSIQPPVDQPRRRVAPPTLCSLESITKAGPLKKKVKKMGKGAIQTETDSQRDTDAEGFKQRKEVSFNETIVILNEAVEEEEEVIVNEEEVFPEEEVDIPDNVPRGINEAARILPVVQKNRCKHLDHPKSKCPALLEKYGERNAAGELVLPDRVDQNGRAFWIIEKIIDKEYGDDGLPVRALVQWQGFTPEEAQWEPATIFADAPAVLYDEGVKDGITDTVIHLGGFARNEKVERIINNLSAANPDIQIVKVFPGLAKLGNKEHMTQQQKQNLRKKLQKMGKAAERKGLKRNADTEGFNQNNN